MLDSPVGGTANAQLDRPWQSRRVSVPALIAEALLSGDVPDASPAEIAAAGQYVDRRVAAMPDVTRLGLRLASAGVYAALSTLACSPYRTVAPPRRAVLARRLTALPLPILGEFVRLTRGLGLVSLYEGRMVDPQPRSREPSA